MSQDTIRFIEETDLDAMHEILTAPHVLSGTMRLPVSAKEQTRNRIKHVDGTFKLVAIRDGRVAGYGELITFPDLPAHRHAGDINLVATHPDFRGRKIGDALMTFLLDLSDNWLQLSRLGLTVWNENKKAIALYESHGFAIEGTLPRYVFRNGRYLDAHMMGRLRD